MGVLPLKESRILLRAKFITSPLGPKVSANSKTFKEECP